MFVPYTLTAVQLAPMPCLCGADDCPAKAPTSKFYFFTMFNVNGLPGPIWWLSRN